MCFAANFSYHSPSLLHYNKYCSDIATDQACITQQQLSAKPTVPTFQNQGRRQIQEWNPECTLSLSNSDFLQLCMGQNGLTKHMKYLLLTFVFET